jgi:hypothetical protein
MNGVSMNEQEIESTVNECLRAVSARVAASIEALNMDDADKALHILRKLKGILPKPEQRHIDSALVELEK